MAPRKPKYPFPLVHIEWKDAQTGHGWEHQDDVQIEIPIVTTIGFLIRDNDEGVMVASTVGSDLHCNARIVIPKGMIVSRKDL